MGSIEGLATLVTGGGSGLGEAAAKKLAADGAHVTICGRTEQKLIDAAERIRGVAAPGVTVAHVVADVTIEAAVEVADGFGTYVAAHVYTPDGIKQAIEAGVRSIEHGNLITKEIAKMMAKNDVWLSPQVVVYLTFSPDLGPVRLAKGKAVEAGLDQMFQLAKEYDLKIAFGTDVVVNPEACADQNREFPL